MRRRYRDCTLPSGDCSVCPLVRDGTDCKGQPITKLELARRAAGFSQQELAALSGVNTRQIQKVENGESRVENITLGNAVAIAKALGVTAEELL